MILFYLLVAVMPLVKHPLWSLTQFGDLTMNKYLGMICLFLALVHLLGRQTPLRLFQGWLPKVFVGFGLATMMSFLFFGPNIPVEVSPLGNWVSFLLLFLTTAILLDSIERLRWTLLALVGGVAFTSLHLLREWQKYGGMAAGVRPGWVTGDPNYFALTALVVMPVALLLGVRDGLPRVQRLFCVGCFLVTLAAFTLAGSRGGFLGLVIGVVVLVLRSRHRVRYLVGSFALFTLLAVAPTSPIERFLNPGRGDQQSTDDRTALLVAGVRMFQDNFLTGIGVGQYKSFVHAFADQEMYNVAHNTYLEVACEFGIFGFAAFAAIIYGAIRAVRTLRPRTSGGSIAETAALGIEIGLISAAAGIFFLSALHVRLLWFVIILAIRLRVLVEDSTPRPMASRPGRRGRSIAAEAAPTT